MTPDLTDDDKAALIELLRETIAADRFFMSPRIRRLKAVLAKLDPPPPPATGSARSLAVQRADRCRPHSGAFLDTDNGKAAADVGHGCLNFCDFVG